MATVTQQLAPNKSPVPRRGPIWTGKPLCEFLSPVQYAEWDEFIERSPHGTVFHSSWWLAVTCASFRLLVVRNEAGHLLGGIPLPLKKIAGISLLHAPQLTPYLGPVFDLSGTEGVCDGLHLMRVCGETLANNLDGFDSFRCTAGATAPDLQGFLWANFRVSLAYTFRFYADQAIPEITRGITRTHLQKLAKAKRLNLKVVTDQGVEALLDLNRMTFERKRAKRPFDDALVSDLWKTANARGQARLYLACTEQGKPIAGLFTVNDKRTTYQIVSGFDPSHLDMPGQNLLLWTAVQDSLNAGRDFDFEGSGLKGVETFYRRWGAKAVPVWRIEKTASLRGVLAILAVRYRELGFNGKSRAT